MGLNRSETRQELVCSCRSVLDYRNRRFDRPVRPRKLRFGRHPADALTRASADDQASLVAWAPSSQSRVLLIDQGDTQGSCSHKVVAMANVDHNKVLADAARQTLRPLGLRRKGRSTIWLDDHYWWQSSRPERWDRPRACGSLGRRRDAPARVQSKSRRVPQCWAAVVLGRETPRVRPTCGFRRHHQPLCGRAPRRALPRPARRFLRGSLGTNGLIPSDSAAPFRS